MIEHLNTKVKKLETQNQNLKDITKSKIYKLLLKNKFKLINWVNSDLIFANTSLKNLMRKIILILILSSSQFQQWSLKASLFKVLSY